MSSWDNWPDDYPSTFKDEGDEMTDEEADAFVNRTDYTGVEGDPLD